MKIALLIVGLLLCLPLPSFAQQGICVDVESSGPWLLADSGSIPERRVPPNESEDSLSYAIPPRFEFSSPAASLGITGSPSIVIRDGWLQTTHRFRSWTAVGDSLDVVFSSGFSGVRGRFARTDFGWQGRLRTFSDAGGTPLWERAFQLRTVGCDTPPRFPASMDRPLPRSIELDSRARIVLAEPVPAALITRSRPPLPGIQLVGAAPMGIFAGADTVLFAANPGGPVSRIELKYASSSVLDQVQQRIIDEFGPPRDLGPLRGASWANRTTVVYIFPGTSPTNPGRVILLDPRLGR